MDRTQDREAVELMVITLCDSRDGTARLDLRERTTEK
jgi:hypothetical protein